MKLTKKTPSSPTILEAMESSSGKTKILMFSKNTHVHITASFNDIEREYVHPKNVAITIDMMWKFLKDYLSKMPEGELTINNLPDVSNWFEDQSATGELASLHKLATQTQKDIFKTMAKENPNLWRFKKVLGLNLEI